MSDLIKKLEVLNTHKEEIIKDVKAVNTSGVSKTQAQNLREYAARTSSIDEILLYIEYQYSRERNFKTAGLKLSEIIKKYKHLDIEVIRYLLGIFARWVMIESKRGEYL